MTLDDCGLGEVLFKLPYFWLIGLQLAANEEEGLPDLALSLPNESFSLSDL